MKKHKILFLMGVYPGYGGTEKVSTILANEFRRQGHKVFIASFEQPHIELLSDLDKGIELTKLKKPVLTLSNIKKLRALVKVENIDIIINQWCLPFYTTLLCQMAISRFETKLISVLHGVPNRSKIEIQTEDRIKYSTTLIQKCTYKLILNFINSIIKGSIRFVYNHSEKYIVLSKSFCSIMVEYAKIKNPNKLTYIYNPITITTDFGTNYFETKKNQLLYLGRMDEENKRVNRIVEAWEKLYDHHPDWKLMLVGEGPHRKELMSYVKTHHIKNVEFTGNVKEEPIEYYKESSILLLTSDLEGFGLVVIEGMSYGVVPIIYGSYPTIYEIIEPGKDGFITKMPYSQEETCNKIELLMENKKLLQSMRIEAQRKSRIFDLGTITKQWNQLFDDLTNA